jgi:integrase
VNGTRSSFTAVLGRKRKNELRLLKLGDFDLTKGTFVVHGKGQKVVIMPIAFSDLAEDLRLEIATRNPDEYLIYARTSRRRPMTAPSLHRWFKRALERAGLPETVKLHEMRHSAADNAYRATGDIVIAQQLLRHASVATTQGYLHPTREDLANALARMQVVRSASQYEAD